MNVCFHCGEPLRGSTLTARVEQRDEPVCCSGCQAVAELIAGTGLGDFYRYRDGSSVRPSEGSQSDKWRVYADPQFAAQFTRTSKQQTSVTLLIEGLRCSACSWLIDQVLRRHAGVHDVSVNAATGRASVIWDNARLNLANSQIQLGQIPAAKKTLKELIAAHPNAEVTPSAQKRLKVLESIK